MTEAPDNMPLRMRIAIVGYGRFGRVHALRARSHPAFEVVCVVDPSSHARDAAQAAGFMTISRLEDLPRCVEAAAVVTPYDTHAEIAITLMRMGIDVLVEKPLAASERDIDALLDTEAATRRTLCTGHLERFNQVLALAPWTNIPQSIAFNRCSHANTGSCSAVLDLMVHDLDISSRLLAHTERETFDIIGVQRTEGAVRAHVLFCGVQLTFSAWHGAKESNARLLWQDSKTQSELCLRHPVAPGQTDALTRQYTAFHERLHGKPSLHPIASAAEGAVAARRAIAIESWS